MNSKKDTLKLVVMPHPFKSKKITKEVERRTYRELFEEFVDTHLPIEYAIIIDKDVKISQNAFDEIPKSDFVVIKMLPAGNGNGQVDGLEGAGIGTKIGGWALAIVGTILLLTGVGAGFGTYLISSGVGLLLSGSVLLLTPLPDMAGREQGEQSPQIRGSRNQTRIDGIVPILLGKHLIVPDNASLPYSTTENNKQILHQLFCAGYNDILIDETTFKVGDTPYANIKLSSDPDPLVLYGSTSHSLFPERVVQNDVGLAIEKDVDGENTPYTVRTTSTNSNKIAIAMSAPRGLIGYDDENNAITVSGTFSFWRADYDTPVDFKEAGYTSYWTKFDTKTLSGKTPDAQRWEWLYDLDNATASDPDYNDNRQYKIAIERTTNNSNSSSDIDDLYVDNIKSYTAEYVSNVYDNARPIVEDTQAELCTISLQVTASDNLNGVIDQLTCVAQLRTNIWDGVHSGPTGWTTEVTTSNPASMFRYVLQNPKVNPHFDTVPDSRIDWDSLEAWYEFCETKGFECNAVINADMTLETVLNSIMSTGRASWLMIDGKYTIVIDDVKSNVVQMFTPRNSWDFSGSKSFADVPTVLKMNFIDEDANYVSAERKVYFDDSSPDDSNPQTINMFGITTADEAWKHGKYLLATMRLRPEAFSFNADIENIVCTRGDRVTVTHDAALIGLTSGRVESVYTNVGVTEIEGFISDEEIPYESGTSYRVRVRQANGTVSEHDLIDQATPSHDVFFVTPVVGITAIQPDDLFTFGAVNEETLDCVVANISPSTDLTANITCLPYAPDIFNADSGIIPDYNPLISLPGDGDSGVSNVDPVYNPNQAINNVTNILAISSANIARAGNALIASRPDAFSLSSPASEVSIIDDGTIVFVGKEDSLLYRTRKTDSFPQEQIGTVVAMNPAGAGLDLNSHARIMYTNKEDGDKIYMMGTSIIDNGSAITTTAGYRPRYVSNDEFLYLDVDGFLRRGLVTDSLDGTQVTTFPVNDYSVHSSDSIIYANPADNSYLYLKSSLDDTVGDKIGETTCSDVHYTDNNIVFYVNHEDSANVYKREVSTSNFDEETPVFNTVSSMWADVNGNVVFASLFDNNIVYSGLADPAIAGGFLEAQATEALITGDLVAGSNRISNISAEDLDKLVVKDYVYNSSLTLDTKVIFKGPNYLLIDSEALATVSGTAIQVVGTRIVLDANRVIIPGTVTADLLEASALNSKARTVGGEFKTEIDLDDGTYKFRKDDGTVVFDFDADRTGSELVIGGQIGGTLRGANGVFEGTLDASENIILRSIIKKQPMDLVVPDVSYTLPVGSTAKAVCAFSENRIVLATTSGGTQLLTAYDFNGTTWEPVGNPYNASGAFITNRWSMSNASSSTFFFYDGFVLRLFSFDGLDFSEIVQVSYIRNSIYHNIAAIGATTCLVVSQYGYYWTTTEWEYSGGSLSQTDIIFLDFSPSTLDYIPSISPMSSGDVAITYRTNSTNRDLDILYKRPGDSGWSLKYDLYQASDNHVALSSEWLMQMTSSAGYTYFELLHYSGTEWSRVMRPPPVLGETDLMVALSSNKFLVVKNGELFNYIITFDEVPPQPPFHPIGM